jgi:hypothetical protein
VSVEINVRVDVQRTIDELRELADRVIPAATSRALNRTIDSGRAEAVRAVSDETGYTRSEVRERMFVKGATPRRWRAELQAFPLSKNLSRFNARQQAPGVRANAWRNTKTYRGSFILKKNGRVVSRVGKERFPLKGLRGPSVRKSFMRPKVNDRIVQRIRTRWPLEFQREIAFRLGRLR